MAEDTPSAGPGRDEQPTGPLYDAYARLRTVTRPREGRVVAGVCVGVGQRLGIDPVVIRIVLVVLTLFSSGAGVLLYVAAWLLLPEEGADRSVAERLFGGSASNRNGAVIAACVVVGTVVISGMVPWGASWWGPLLTILVVIGFVALMRRGPGEAATADPTPPLPSDATSTAEPATDVAMDRATGAETQAAPPPSYPMGDGQPRSWTQHAAAPAPQAFWEQPDPLGLEEPEPEAPTPVPQPPAPPPARRGSHVLFWATLGVAGLVTIALAGLALPPAAYIAAALGVIGLGLVVGIWYGKSGGLIALGIPLALALVPASLFGGIGSWSEWGVWDERGGTGQLQVSPTSVAELERTYSHRAGDFTLDLTGVDFSDTDDVSVLVDQGAGELRIRVPEEVDVEVTSSVGLGENSVFGESTEPFEDAEHTDLGSDGPGGGTLRIDASLGLGELEVSRGDTVDRPEPPEPPEPPERPEPPDTGGDS